MKGREMNGLTDSSKQQEIEGEPSFRKLLKLCCPNAKIEVVSCLKNDSNFIAIK